MGLPQHQSRDAFRDQVDEENPSWWHVSTNRSSVGTCLKRCRGVAVSRNVRTMVMFAIVDRTLVILFDPKILCYSVIRVSVRLPMGNRFQRFVLVFFWFHHPLRCPRVVCRFSDAPPVDGSSNNSFMSRCGADSRRSTSAIARACNGHLLVAPQRNFRDLATLGCRPFQSIDRLEVSPSRCD